MLVRQSRWPFWLVGLSASVGVDEFLGWYKTEHVQCKSGLQCACLADDVCGVRLKIV